MPLAPDVLTALRAALARNRFLTDRASATAARVDVVVPVYNAAAATATCLASVARHTDAPFRLAVIDDGSTDPAVATLLACVRDAAPAALVIARPDNLGFVHTVNQGFVLSATSDVVVLNSDTVVTAGWLAKLLAVARGRPDVATVTPLTNNGTICSVPEPLADNALPGGYDVDTFAALVEATSPGMHPEAPTGVGFCMLVTRRALEAVGRFDAATFGRGYGEENDFCQRAIAAGFVNLIAADTFVYHRGRASFGTGAAERVATNLARVAAKHPQYLADVDRFTRRHPLRAFHTYLRASVASQRGAHGTIRTRVLHLLHEDGGGTEKHARELAAIDEPSMLSFVLGSDGERFVVDEYYRGHRLRSLRFPLRTPIGGHGPLRDDDYRAALTTVCRALEVALIHVHHLRRHTLDVADVAAARGIPYVVTLHDYHTLCPSYTLLTPDGRPCGACVGHAGAMPDACMAAIGEPATWLPAYQVRMRAFLRDAARLFTPSAAARDIVAGRYPEIADRIDVIEHGYARTTQVGGPEMAPHPPQRSHVTGEAGAVLDHLAVAVIGGLDVPKGGAVFRALLRANRRAEITFHFYGTTPDSALQTARDVLVGVDGARFVNHGPYGAGEIVDRLVADRIDVGLLLSIWPETFSYTLSELVDAGVPVIAGDLGAPAERIRRHRLGWTVSDIRDPAATLAILDQLLDDPRVLADVSAHMDRAHALTPLASVWRWYADIYERTIAARRTAMTVEPDRRYVAWLAMQLAEETEPLRQRVQALESEVASLRERLRSPRHRIADTAAGGLQKIPVVWPIVARVTEAVLRREARGGRTGGARPL